MQPLIRLTETQLDGRDATELAIFFSWKSKEHHFLIVVQGVFALFLTKFLFVFSSHSVQRVGWRFWRLFRVPFIQTWCV